jgi:translation initiation factor IF-1
MVSLLVAALLAAAPPSDTVYTVDGGRITGTVLEESPAAGVTLQLPDGSVRRVDRAQIQRIEFADGTVSTVHPTAPPAAPAAAPAAAAAAAAPPPTATGPIDTAYFKGGGRVRGTVMEESASTGVKVRLLDGSIRAYPMEEFTRIEYADGTVSTPQAAPRASEPAPAAKAKPAEPVPAPVDNVYFLGGGRVRGTVIEENPKTGVKVRLLDGSIQVYSRDDLVRIEYADGSVSRRVPQPAPVAAPPVVPAPVPQPAAAPPPAPAPKLKEETPQAFPLYVSAGLGITFLGGDLAPGTRVSSLLQTEQAHLSGEVGLRLSPSFALGVYGDVGAGDVASAVRDSCQAQGIDCTGQTTHWGVLVRHTWSPLSRRPVWLSLGTGWETAGVVASDSSTGGNRDVTMYRGREYLRIGAGVDFRSNDVIALGLYGSFSVGEYDQVKDMTGTTSVDRASHTTGQIGLRLTLFP